MNEPSRRQKRVADMLVKEISMFIQSEIRDPRIGFVTVSHVSISPDLRQARVYVNVLGDEKARKDSLIGLSHAAPHIRTHIAKTVYMRRAPDLEFVYDDGLDKLSHIDKLLKEISNNDPSQDN